MSPFQFQYQKIEDKRPRSVLEREERHSYVDSKEVIGRDQEKEDIISLLFCEDDRQQNLEVISVIGFGGLGKTTLAQLVYNDSRVQTGFDLCLWTCINYLADLEPVLVKILTSVLKSKPQDLDLDQLQRGLREKIEGKKYLLVMDDVWDENPSNWRSLKTLLNCGKIGSKVLITTRKTSVARCLDAKEPFYRLNVLSEESAWFLFVKMAFKDGEFDDDAELASTGKQILHQCGYVPLAISIIGSMLRSRKKDKEEWLSFMEKEFVEVVSNDADDGNLMQVLKVSYNDLPLALKHCFAYCSVYPKDHVFYKDELVRMWIAQGFIEPHDKKSLEEVAEDYFFHMVDRCFFQEIQENNRSFGDLAYKCKMHDLLHDLAIQVAGSESKCFMAEDVRNMVRMSSSVPYADIDNYNYGLKRLRKLIVPWQCNLLRVGLQFLTSLEELSITYYEEQQVVKDNEDSECCRAMSWSGLKKLQKVYLSLRGMECCFPKWTLHLPCLQDLRLQLCGQMNVDDWVAQQTQSNSLLELLIHTHKEDPLLWIHDIPWKLLPSLRTLEIQPLLSSIPDGIQKLTSLQRLRIWVTKKLKEIPKWMINLTSLQYLSLIDCSPELEVRCKRETGVDWHLISHIPTIQIDCSRV